MRPDLNHFTRPQRLPAVGDIARQLRELPSEAAPPYDFAEFRRRSRERSASTRQWITWPHAAAAAGLTAVVAAMALLGTARGPAAKDDVGPANGARQSAAIADAPASASSASASPAAASPASTTAATAPPATATPASASPPAGADSLEQARIAREWLARQPAEPALVRAGPRLTVASLEDRIAWFDDALTDQRLHGASPAQLKVLQQERARLVSSLAQVRYAEALVAGGS